MADEQQRVPDVVREFKTIDGYEITFGTEEHPRRVAWADPSTGDWEPRSDNKAGWLPMEFDLAPVSICETLDGVIAHQSGTYIELVRVHAPFYWGVKVMTEH